jgi:hypothetical protein
MKTAHTLVVSVAVALLANVGCSSDSTPAAATGALGGPV